MSFLLMLHVYMLTCHPCIIPVRWGSGWVWGRLWRDQDLWCIIQYRWISFYQYIACIAKYVLHHQQQLCLAIKSRDKPTLGVILLWILWGSTAGDHVANLKKTTYVAYFLSRHIAYWYTELIKCYNVISITIIAFDRTRTTLMASLFLQALNHCVCWMAQKYRTDV